MFQNSFLERVQKAMAATGSDASVPNENDLVSKPLYQAIFEECKSAQKAAEIIQHALLPQMKSIGTVDIAALRVVSLSERIPVIRNDDTQFLNWLESVGNMPSITDYQYRIMERDSGNRTSVPFNVDAALPANVQSTYGQRYNTTTAFGDCIQGSFMMSSIAMQQRDVDVMQDNIDDELMSIRRGMNAVLLSNTEVVSETTGQVPQLGGFITRSTSNAIAAGGSNLTNTIIQTAVNSIRTSLGTNKHQFLLFCGSGQLAVVRDLMINRFPGETSATWKDSLGQRLGDQLKNYGLSTQVAYVAYPGGTIPILFEDQLPSGNAILFAAEYPRLAKFRLNGQTGPYIMARPEATLYDKIIVFDMVTLDDPIVKSRVSVTGLAS